MSNILVITPYFDPAINGGGGQLSVENLVDTLKDYNKISVVSLNHDFNTQSKLSDTFLNKNLEIERYFFSFSNFFLILNSLKKIKFDYIYFNSFFSPICIFFQIYYYFSPSIKILSPKGELYDAALRVKKIRKFIWLYTFKYFFNTIKIHITSKHEEKYIKKYINNKDIKIARDIPNKIPMVNFNDDLNNKKYINIIYISRINPKKNLIFIPDILNNIKININIDIYGEIADAEYYQKALSKFKKLPKNIKWNFKGILNSELSKTIFTSYHIFLFPTLGENFGYVVYDSLSCGCPVLLSKDTTPWDDLERFGAGFNLNLKSIDPWIKHIEYFNNLNTKDRQLIFENCRSYISNKYDINKIKNENLKLFE